MLIGVPKEIKNHEYRVGMTPASIHEAVVHGHSAIVETGAGAGIGCSDADYRAAGAAIAEDAQQVFAKAELVVKVKEPQAAERRMLRPGQILFAYLHLAPDPEQAKELIDSGAVCIAYETVTDRHGGLPLLAPMSQVAGRMSIQAGANCLERENGGKGILLGGVPGVPAANVVVIGGGVVGENAIYMGIGMAAHVTVLDRDIDTLRHLARRFGPALTTVYSTRKALDDYVVPADLVIGAVLVAGHEAPKLISAEMIAKMAPGSVLVDVAIDQGGCSETSRPTTHAAPTYIVDGVVHYCVANMPGAVPRTSTFALNNVTFPYILALADKGYKRALIESPRFRDGFNVCAGQVTNKAVADDLGYDHIDPLAALSARG